MASVLLLIALLPAIGALCNGVRAFARPLQPKNRAITNFFALASTGLSAVLAAWMLLMHFVDMFWLVMPEYSTQVEATEYPGFGRSLLLAALCWVGVGAVWFAWLIYFAGAGSLVPARDPRLPEALAHEVY